MRHFSKISDFSRRLTALLCAVVLLASPMATPQLMAVTQTRAHKKSGGTTTGKNSQKSAAKTTSRGKSASAPAKQSAKGGNTSSASKSGGKARKGGTPKASKASKAELQRREEDARKEVKRTQEELRQTEASIKRGLSELSRLESGIAASRKETEALGLEVRKLNGRISGLQSNIATHSSELEQLRAEYLKAVKKMRTTKKRNSTVAFLFGSKDLAQAERRMRYLKDFSEWKDARIHDIDAKVAVLKRRTMTCIVPNPIKM